MSTSIRNQMLMELSNAKGQFLSGQELAEKIGCSRTAIWKHIEELRKSGVKIEAIRKKGYRLISFPDTLTESEILFGLKTEILGKKVVHLDTTASTQIIAHKLAREGAEEGTLVIAEEQTNGKGRFSREWHSPSQKGIWMSLILRPIIPLEKAPHFTLITAAAVAKAIEETTGLDIEIKWPNDILHNNKKLAGILTELQGESDIINYLVIGIGINVNHEDGDFPPLLANIATSIKIATNNTNSRSELVHHILMYLEKYYRLYCQKGFAPIKIIWETYANYIGKKITAKTMTGEIEGIALGITDEGVLLIEDDEQKVHRIYSGDIEITPFEYE